MGEDDGQRPPPPPLPLAQRRAVESPLEYAGPRTTSVEPRGDGDEDRGAFFVVRMVIGTLAWLALAYFAYAIMSEW
jgi:hypothetical protein